MRRARLLDVRIDGYRVRQRARGEVPFLAWLVDAVAGNARRAHLRVGPRVRHRLQRLVRIRAVGDADARVELVQAPVRLDHRFAVSHQVVAHAEAWNDRVPLHIVLLGERQIRDAQRPVGVRQLMLLRRPAVVMIEARAEVERRASEGVLVGEEPIDRVQLRHAQQVALRTVAERSDLRRRRRRKVDRRRQPVAADVLAHVAGVRLCVAEPAGFEQQFGPELEVVRPAEQAVLEVRQSACSLPPLPIRLLFLVAVEVLRELRVDDLVSRRIRVGEQREVVPEDAVPPLRVHVVRSSCRTSGTACCPDRCSCWCSRAAGSAVLSVPTGNSRSACCFC